LYSVSLCGRRLKVKPMPNQNDPTQNPNPVTPPADQPANQAATPPVPPIIFPQSDLPPLSPVFQNLPKPDAPATPPTNGGNGSGAPPDIPSVVPKAKKKFGGGKIIATILGLIVLIGGVGAGIILTQQQQLFKQKAVGACGTRNTGCLYYDCSQKIDCATGSIVMGFCNTGYPPTPGGDPCGIGATPPSCTAAGYACTSNGQCCNNNCVNGRCASPPSTPPPSGQTSAPEDSRCAIQIANGSTTLGVGSLYPTCYVNHFWCQTSKPGGCSDQLIGNAVQSASYSKNCGTEQIDLWCPTCPNYIASQQNKLNGQLFISKIYPNECTTSTTPPNPTPTPTSTPIVTPTPTPTETPIAPSCIQVKAYDDSWTALTDTQLSALTPGDVVNFCVNGSAPSGTFDKAQFMINTVLKPETTTKRPGTEDFCQSYTILSTDTTVSVRSKIHHSSGVWVGEGI
jgi:hypothetical protein